MTVADLIEDGEDFSLASLPDDELVEPMRDDLYNGLRDEIAEGAAFGKAIGADACCRDAGVAIETAEALIQQRRAA